MNTEPAPRVDPPKCNWLLERQGGYLAKCILLLGHQQKHIGFGPRGDIQAITWAQGSTSERSYDPSGKGN